MYISLNGNWKLRESGSQTLYDAVVPGCNYLDLMANGAIEDPFFGMNEKDAYWVAKKDWDYIRKFDVPKEALSADKVILSCSQLDTLCDVYINEKLVGKANNAHLLYEFDIKPYLVFGENEIRIRFFSPVNYVKKEQKKWKCPPNNNGQDGIPLIRKPQCHFGWDWGPVLPPSGITGDIGIAIVNKARAKDIRIVQSHTNGKVRLDIEAEAELFTQKINWAISVTHPDGTVQSVKGESEGGGIRAEFDIENPELWWTNDLSDKPEQALYTVSLELCDGETPIDKLEKKIGLRTIALNREKDEYGYNCQFVLNGKPLFVKGANWIPPDSFITRADEKTLEFYIKTARFSNFNIIRIWGGGYYGSDTFYELCDRYGILIWQDFQFACQAYPFFIDEFRENVIKEAEYQIKRLRHHPSLALWCGNNEIEQMTPAWMHRVKYVKWTKKYFYDILPPIVEKNDGVTPYIPGSPYGSAFLKDTADDNVGDTHLWQVWHGLQPMTYYRGRLTRLCSEFGFESLPDIKTIYKFAGEGPHSIESEVFNAHQKCLSGNLKMMYYISTRFRLPEKFEDIVYLSQITQQECIKDATEHWRRNRGRCNGAIYWQFNDCWPVCSWASVDYYGNYKALQYTARRFNAPFAVSIENYSDRASVWVINDTLKEIPSSVTYRLMRFDGTMVKEGRAELIASPLTSKLVVDLNKEALADVEDIKGCVLAAELIKDGEVVSRATALFDWERFITLPPVNIKKEVAIKDGCAEIKLTADKFARLTCVQSATNTLPFSDNFFDILPGETITITQPLDREYTLEELEKSYTVKTVSGVKSNETPKDIKKLRRRVFSKFMNFVLLIIYKLHIK